MLSCFKAYDVRGRVPDTLDAPLAYALGRSVLLWGAMPAFPARCCATPWLEG